MEAPVWKPSVPPVLLLAAGLWIASALSFWLFQYVDGAACMLAAALGSALSVLIAVFCCRKGAGRLLLAMLGCALGVATAAGCAAQLHGLQQQVQQASSADYVFTVVEDPQAGDFGDSCIAQVRLETGETACVRVNLPEGADLSCWDVFAARCRLKPCSDAASSYYWQRGCVGSATVHAISKLQRTDIVAPISWLRQAGLRLFDGEDGPGAAMLRALLFGNRESLFSLDFYGDVKAAGLAHIVAVSGSHLAVLCSFLTVFLQAVRCPRRISIGLQTSFIVGYVLLTGAPLSAIRAAVMTLCAIGSFFARRRASSLNALAVCIIAMVCLSPKTALSVSFALSSCAVLGIILFSSYMQRWFDVAFHHRASGVSQTCAMTMSANAFTAPLSISLFGQFSLISPVANVIVVPLFALLCVGGMVAVVLSLVLPSASALLIPAAVYLAQGLCDAISLCASVPYACIPATGSLPVLSIATALIAALIWHYWPAPKASSAYMVAVAATAAMAAMIVLMPGVHDDEVVMMDVGQGDAFVLRSGGKALLIDTGTQDSKVLAGLARHDVRSLDAVVITHPDDDHCGSLSAVLDVVGVKRICVAADLMECPCQNCAKLRAQMEGQTICPIKQGDSLCFGDFCCKVVSPETYHDEGGNSDSVVLAASVDCNQDGAVDWTGLFCGDAESETMNRLVGEGRVGGVDIFKVGHHGSKNSVDSALMSVLKPKISLVSVGAGNRYGHPNGATLDTLQSCGSRVLRTDEVGDVVCKLSTDRISVQTVR